MRIALKETNWDQVIGHKQNIEKANENFTTVLLNAAKKSNIPLYRQRRPIELESRIIVWLPPAVIYRKIIEGGYIDFHAEIGVSPCRGVVYRKGKGVSTAFH